MEKKGKGEGALKHLTNNLTSTPVCWTNCWLNFATRMINDLKNRRHSVRQSDPDFFAGGKSQTTEA
ncbi:hypothetical protein M5D96_004399, partial [Drosophila gunungcola]